MDVRQFKKIKEDLTSQLQERLKELIVGPEVSVFISDDLERIVVTLLTSKQNKESAATMVTENLLIYNIKDPHNLLFQGYGKTTVYKNNLVNGFSADYGQIDLTTLYMLQQFIYNFCLETSLIENKETSQDETKESETTILNDIKNE